MDDWKRYKTDGDALKNALDGANASLNERKQARAERMGQIPRMDQTKRGSLWATRGMGEKALASRKQTESKREIDVDYSSSRSDAKSSRNEVLGRIAGRVAALATPVGAAANAGFIADDAHTALKKQAREFNKANRKGIDRDLRKRQEKAINEARILSERARTQRR